MEHLKVYESQKDDLLSNGSLTINERIFLLKKLYFLIKSNIKQISKALFLDLGKHENESYFSEIGLILREIKHSLKNIHKWVKPKKVKNSITLFSGKSKIIFEPLGQVLIISPWNYPFYLSISPLIESIAVGNRNIIKPSEFSINTFKLLKGLINKNFDAKTIFVADSDVSVAKNLLEHKFDLIFFTGSEKVGQIIAEKASKFHTPVILELGGKCPAIIFDDIDLEKAANKIMFGKLLNAGQTCIAPDYVLVPKNKANKFIEHANKYVLKTLGNKPCENEEYSKIIDQNHYQRLIKFLPNELKNYCVGQKIVPFIYKTNFGDEIMKDEIFGPILPVIEYENWNEVKSFVNSKNNPLTIYFFTNKQSNISLHKEIKSGAIVINETVSQISSPFLPFGGVGTSGNGKYHGFEGFKTFSNLKSFFKKGKFNISLGERPYSFKKLKLLKKILK